MQVRDSELPPRPPGVVNALLSGFNAVAGNVSVIFFPVALDVFLWLGPRLKAEHAVASAYQDMLKLQESFPPPLPLPAAPTVTPADIEKLSSGFNLFSRLRTYPLGVFSLMMDNGSDVSPLGLRPGWDIPNWGMAALVFLLLTGIGLVVGSLYFYFVSRVALKPEQGTGLPRAIFHSLMLWSLWTFALVLITPLLVGASLFLADESLAVLLVFLLLAWPVTWVCLMIFFSTHAVFTQSKNALASLMQNFRVMRYGMPPMGWFALIALTISHGMDLLWRIPPAGSWMALVGIFGHAFISTSLLAASFIFYRDLNSWVEAALEWLKTHQITSARA